jgi:hypothetical protein
MIESANPLLQRHTSLSAHIVGLCRYLRAEGFAIAAPEEADALRALAILNPFDSSEHLNLALKTCLARTPMEVERFEALANAYWQESKKGVDAKIAEQANAKPKPQRAKPQDPQFQSLKDWLFGKNDATEEAVLHTYSAVESLSKKDFSSLSEDELDELFELIQQIARRLARQQNRRFEHGTVGALDLRRTLRQNLRRGGEMVELKRQKRQKRRLELVLLCDVSRSMELYSRFLIQFAFAFQQVFQRINTFVFSTQLTKITEILSAGLLWVKRGGNFQKSLEHLSEAVPHWSGGTRIGASLTQFVETFGQKHLSKRTVVIILSDGWDMDDTASLTAAMRTIHRRAHRLIWLNPLAGNPNFEPSAAGMAAAMPFVDVFAAGHNAAALRDLGKILR